MNATSPHPVFTLLTRPSRPQPSLERERVLIQALNKRLDPPGRHRDLFHVLRNPQRATMVLTRGVRRGRQPGHPFSDAAVENSRGRIHGRQRAHVERRHWEETRRRAGS